MPSLESTCLKIGQHHFALELLLFGPQPAVTIAMIVTLLVPIAPSFVRFVFVLLHETIKNLTLAWNLINTNGCRHRTCNLVNFSWCLMFLCSSCSTPRLLLLPLLLLLLPLLLSSPPFLFFFFFASLSSSAPASSHSPCPSPSPPPSSSFLIFFSVVSSVVTFFSH